METLIVILLVLLLLSGGGGYYTRRRSYRGLALGNLLYVLGAVILVVIVLRILGVL